MLDFLCKSYILYENHYGEALGSFGRLWEALGTSGKLWETLGSSGRLWEASGSSATYSLLDMSWGSRPEAPKMIYEHIPY